MGGWSARAAVLQQTGTIGTLGYNSSRLARGAPSRRTRSTERGSCGRCGRFDGNLPEQSVARACHSSYASRAFQLHSSRCSAPASLSSALLGSSCSPTLLPGATSDLLVLPVELH